MSISYYIPFSFLVLLAIFAVVYSFIGKQSRKKSIIAFSTGIGSVFIMFLMSIFIFPELEANARYKPEGELKIIWNQADSDYYINYLGRPIKLRDACPEQIGDYIPKELIREIPTVSVYEKTYLPMWGLILSNTPEVHFVHGMDTRINQTIEIK